MWILCRRDLDRCVQDVPNPLPILSVIQVSLITDTISSENVDVPFPSIDIDSQSDIDILIVNRKR